MLVRKHRNNIKANLLRLLREKPESKLVENRYRTMRAILEYHYPILFKVLEDGLVPKETVLQMLKDGTYLDRIIRKNTEGQEVLKKTILSQEFQLNEL